MKNDSKICKAICSRLVGLFATCDTCVLQGQNGVCACRKCQGGISGQAVARLGSPVRLCADKDERRYGMAREV
ncbi:MAG: hypothetical protein ACLS8C_03905 [Dysgonomonas mossii]